MRLVKAARQDLDQRVLSVASLVVPAEAQAIELEAAAAMPDYLVDTYSWAYLRPSSLQLLDRHLVVNAILWGNYHSLVTAACSEFTQGDQVLQAASVYGNLSSRLADTVGDKGSLDVIDVAPLQVAHCRRKLAGLSNVRVRVADAANPGKDSYSGVSCFFLLHEVPDWKKHQVVNALLEAIRPGGKVVFMDYHRPVYWHPLRPVMAVVFRWLEPYAEGLVSRSIMEFASHPEDFCWRKETSFGGLYQKVVVNRLR